MSNVSRISKIEKRVQVKARMIEDGPRKRQAVVIGCLWIGKQIEICYNRHFYPLGIRMQSHLLKTKQNIT